MGICDLTSAARTRPSTMPLRSLALASVMLVTAPASFAWAQVCDPPCPTGSHCACAIQKPGQPCPPGAAGKCTPAPLPPRPAPMTTLGQALVSIGNVTYEFAVNSDDGHVLYTYWQLGGGGQGWNDLGSIAPDVTATTAPAAAAVGNYIFVTVTGSDKHIYLNQGTPPNWVGWK